MNAFNAYCRRATTDHKPAQDFLIDFNSDSQAPKTITSWRALSAYLHDCDACFEAFDAAKIVWHNFEAQQRRHSRKRQTKTKP